MRKLILIIALILIIYSPSVFANKQFLVPGYGYIDQKVQDEQWLIPGYGYIDEEPSPAAPSGFSTRIIWISLIYKIITGRFA